MSEDFVRLICVTCGGFVPMILPRADAKMIVQKFVAFKSKPPEQHTCVFTTGTAAIDLAATDGMYIAELTPGPQERLADAIEKTLGEGESWRG